MQFEKTKMEGIGNTPLVKLRHLTDFNSADIYVKIEGANPTGSMKDRMALAMIEGAEKRPLYISSIAYFLPHLQY